VIEVAVGIILTMLFVGLANTTRWKKTCYGLAIFTGLGLAANLGKIMLAGRAAETWSVEYHHKTFVTMFQGDGYTIEEAEALWKRCGYDVMIRHLARLSPYKTQPAELESRRAASEHQADIELRQCAVREGLLRE